MKYAKKIIVYIVAVAFMLCPMKEGQTHSGRTDSAGGHHDYKNASGLGSYHYHHGYGPHLHPNGKCPYESSSSSTTSTKKKGNSTLKKAQKKLNQLGYHCGTPDGIMGAKTRKAIKKFQKKKHIKITGTLTKKTKKKLGI